MSEEFVLEFFFLFLFFFFLLGTDSVVFEFPCLDFFLEGVPGTTTKLSSLHFPLPFSFSPCTRKEHLNYSIKKEKKLINICNIKKKRIKLRGIKKKK